MQRTTKSNKLNDLIESIAVFISVIILISISIAAYVKIQFKTTFILAIISTILLYIAYKIFTYFYIRKKVKNNHRQYKRDIDRDKLAAEVSSNFHDLIKNKQLNRNDILTVKNMLNEGLSNNAAIYKKYYKFKNDAHFIYTALKDRNLSKQNLKMINSYLNLCADQ